MNRKMMKILLLALAIGIVSESLAQEDRPDIYSLYDIVEIARNQSIAAKQAETTREIRYWQFQRFRSNFKPQLALDGQFPGFNRSFDEVRQNDGTFEFLPVSQNNSNVNLRLSQQIAPTGGRVFLNSGVNRFDNFTEGNEYWIYRGTPVEIGIVQPLFQYNDLVWDRKIEPLRYDESQREFLEEMEFVSVNATRRFFDLMLAQISLQIAMKNLANNDTIYKIAEGRYNLGKIAENELLQLELTLMNSRQAVAEATLDLETFMLRLKAFTGLAMSKTPQLLLPERLPDFDVNEEKALAQARMNRTETIAFRRRQLEADREIAQAKGETGLNADLFARIGLTNNTDQNAPIGELYQEAENQQIVTLGFEIPILDWGRRKSAVKTAEANKRLVDYTVSQDQLNFEEEVLTQVRQFEMLKEQVKITRLADDIAQRRYDISKNRYMIGKIGITDLNIALQEKDQAKQRYIQSLEDFWAAYYNLRMLTLYDFEANEQITFRDELRD
jgi:outer membrane protein TolC